MVFYFIFLSFFANLTAAPSDYITIKYVNHRPLFYSEHTGYFWSIGVNTFMQAGDNNPLKEVFKKKYCKEFYNQQLKLIQDHGFNTISGWSNVKFLDAKLSFGIVLFDDGKYSAKTPLINFKGEPPSIGDSNEPCPIGDPYDENYKKSLDTYISYAVLPYESNTQLLVYWLGSEFGLGDSDATDFSKYVYSKGVQAHLTNWLEKKHHTISRLNKEWGASFKNFKEAAATKPLTSTKYQKELTEFSVDMIKDWFKLVVKTIRKYDPHHLISSPKLSVWDFEPFLEKAFELKHFESFKNIFDVVSVDWYSKEPVHREQGYKDLEKLSLLLHVPVLVAEFGTRQSISGWSNTPGAKSIVSTQKERAEKYATQIMAIFNNPVFIGAHWFRWQDHINQKEQFNKGMIKVEDGEIKPYAELMEAMRKTNKEITQRRGSNLSL